MPALPVLRSATTVLPSAAAPLLRRAVEGAFRALAQLRGARAFHPRGVTFRARATVDLAGGLADREEVDAVVRLSRGAGLPAGLPDVHGVAVRFVDAHGPDHHQDLLLATTFTAPVLRHLLRPTVRLDRADATTLLPYRRPSGERVAFRAVPPDHATVDAVVAALPERVELLMASLLGPWQRVASVELLEVLDDDLAVRFDPWNTTDELVPAGVLNVLRAAAYVGSRAGTTGAAPVRSAGSGRPTAPGGGPRPDGAMVAGATRRGADRREARDARLTGAADGARRRGASDRGADQLADDVGDAHGQGTTRHQAEDRRAAGRPAEVGADGTGQDEGHEHGHHRHGHAP